MGSAAAVIFVVIVILDGAAERCVGFSDVVGIVIRAMPALATTVGATISYTSLPGSVLEP